MKTSTLAVICGMLTYNLLNAQNVGINTTGATPNASAQLDLNTGNTFTSPNGKGLLVPNVALTGTGDNTTIAGPATSLFVYNTATAGSGYTSVVPGYYYWDGTKWVAFSGNGSKNWALIGNAGTTASSSAIGSTVNNNFIGTTDVNNFVVATNNKEVARFLSSGTENMVVNSTTAFANDIVSAYGSAAATNAIAGYATSTAITSAPSGIYGQTSSANGSGVVGIGASTASYTTGTYATGVFGAASAPQDIGVYGVATYTGTVANYPVGVFGRSNNLSGTGVMGIAGYTGSSTSAIPVGVVGIVSNQFGTGVIGINNATGTAISPTAIYGSSSASLAGNGVMGLGGTSSGGYFILPTGTTANGGVFTGGSKGFGIVATCYFTGNAAAVNNGYGGGSFTGKGTGSAAAGTFTSSQYAYVSYCLGGTWYKIYGTGTVSSILRGDLKDQRIIYAPEATEILLQDYGVGALGNGRVHIIIDSVLQKNITVNEKHPLKVFITLKGNCNGVYVTNETSTGFDVVELNNGTSNVSFNYQLVANRADEYNEKGELESLNADVRLAKAAIIEPSRVIKAPSSDEVNNRVKNKNIQPRELAPSK